MMHTTHPTGTVLGQDAQRTLDGHRASFATTLRQNGHTVPNRHHSGPLHTKTTHWAPSTTKEQQRMLTQHPNCTVLASCTQGQTVCLLPPWSNSMLTRHPFGPGRTVLGQDAPRPPDGHRAPSANTERWHGHTTPNRPMDTCQQNDPTSARKTSTWFGTILC